MTTIIRRMSGSNILALGMERKAAAGDKYVPTSCKCFGELVRRAGNNLDLVGTEDKRAKFAAANAKSALDRASQLAGAAVTFAVDSEGIRTGEINIGGAVPAPVETVIRTSSVSDSTLDTLMAAIERLKSKDMTQARAILVIHEGGVEGSDLAKGLGVKSVTQAMIAKCLNVTAGYVSAVVVNTDAVFDAVDSLV